MASSSDTSDKTNEKSRRPAESAFKQQRLPAWQPILTAGTVLPTFFVIGIAFIPVGIGLLYFSDEVKEHTIDYTDCIKSGDTITCVEFIKQTNGTIKCKCEVDFTLTEDFKAEVYFYYGLSNYYQNHRRYVKSRDDNQLLGKLTLPLSSDCDPFSSAVDSNGVRNPVAPCGAIANSLFNDTLDVLSKEQNKLVPVLRTGIAWDSDKSIKFRNPPIPSGGTLKDAFNNFTKPANWAKHVWELDLQDANNNGFQNEDLIVWMRTAALPTFRKLYRRVDHSKDGFRTGLKKGSYQLTIEYNYPVTDFQGTKSFIISTTSLLGGKNPFLGVAYVVVGTVCLLLGIVLLIIHVRCSKRIPTLSATYILDHGVHGLIPKRELQIPYIENSTQNINQTEDPKNEKHQSILNTVNEVPEEKDPAIGLDENKGEHTRMIDTRAMNEHKPKTFSDTQYAVASSSTYPRERSLDAAPPPPPPLATFHDSLARRYNNSSELPVSRNLSYDNSMLTRSELTAAKQQANSSAIKLRIHSSRDLQGTTRKISVETHAKTETASAGMVTSYTPNTPGKLNMNDKEKLQPFIEKLESKIENLEPKIENLEPKIENFLEPKIEKLELKTEELEHKIEEIEPKIEKLEPKAEKLESKIEKLEPKIENFLEPKIENFLEPNMDKLEPETEKLEPKIEKLEPKIEPKIEKLELNIKERPDKEKPVPDKLNKLKKE